MNCASTSATFTKSHLIVILLALSIADMITRTRCRLLLICYTQMDTVDFLARDTDVVMIIESHKTAP